MKKVSDIACQGDVLIRRIESIPNTAVEVQESKEVPGKHTVCHSETGHHHVIDAKKAKFYVDSADTMVGYISVFDKHVDLEHLRDYDKHETLRLPTGDYELRRQREWSPEGWRQVAD
jgi:hypothetical protein